MKRHILTSLSCSVFARLLEHAKSKKIVVQYRSNAASELLCTALVFKHVSNQGKLHSFTWHPLSCFCFPLDLSGERSSSDVIKGKVSPGPKRIFFLLKSCTFSFCCVQQSGKENLQRTWMGEKYDGCDRFPTLSASYLLSINCISVFVCVCVFFCFKKARQHLPFHLCLAE